MLVVLALSSCKSTFYQVVTTQSENLKTEQNALFFEDENCKVYYNLWSEGGNAGFFFHNKTDMTIYVNLAESFFVKNGMAYDYSLNRTFSSSTSQSVTVQSAVNVWGEYKNGLPVLNSLVQSNKASNVENQGAVMPAFFGESSTKGKTTTTGKSVSIAEHPIVAIPSHTP